MTAYPPQPYAYAPQPPPRRTRWLIGGAVVLTLVLVAVVGVVVFTYATDSDGGNRPANMLAGKYPTKPTAAWAVTADELGAERIWSPESQAAVYSSVGFVDAGPTIVIRVLDDGGGTPRLIGLDTGSGEQRWAIPADPLAGCATRVIGDILPCIVGDSVDFIRVSDGTVASSYRPDFSVADVAADDGVLVVAGYGRSGGKVQYDDVVVTSGTPAEPESRWTTTVDTSGCAYGSGDVVDVTVEDGFVGLYLGAGAGALRLSDGSELIEGGRLYGVYPGLGAVAVPCLDPTRSSPYTGTFFDRKGKELRVGPLPLSSSVLVTPITRPPVLTDKNVAVDFATGERRWTLPGEGIGYAKFALVGDMMVIPEEGDWTGLDARTGEPKWTVTPSEQGWSPSVTDGARLIGADEGSVSAVSLVDGRIAWRVASDAYPHVGVARNGMVVVTPAGISLYPATG